MSTQINLSDIILCPEFAQEFTATRYSKGKVIQGRYVEQSEEINVHGVVSATNELDIQMIPEGDRSKESKTFHTTEKLYITRNINGQKANADVVHYDNFDWKIVTTIDAGVYGYYKSIGVNIAPTGQ